MAGVRRRPHSGQLQIINPSDDRYGQANALTASAYKIRRGQSAAAGALGDINVKQASSRAFYYYDTVGEVKYASQFYARMLAPLELYAAEMKENTRSGKIEIVRTENPQAIAALERVQDPGGGRQGLQSAYGRLMFLTGEALLFVSQKEGEEREQWEMLSTDELRVSADGKSYSRLREPSSAEELYQEPGDDDYVPINAKTAVAYRLWKAHPRHSGLPDAPLASALDIAEELLGLTQAIRARIKSRLAGNGLLLIPEEVSPKPPAPEGDEDPKADPFMEDLIRHITASIVDEGSASAVAPIIIRGPAEFLEKIRHLQLVDPTQLYPEVGLRNEARERLAVALDMPVEALLGYRDSNHWSAWLVDEQGWKSHGQPIADQFVGDLSSAYFRPELEKEGVPDWEKYLIWYDPAGVVNHPNKSQDAKDVHRAGALSDEALRDATGFDEDDAPSEEEKKQWLATYARDPVLAVTGEPSQRDVSANTAGGPQIEAPPAASETVAKEPPPAPPEGTASMNGHGGDAAARFARLAGAADLALLRCREVAGNRLRSYAKRNPEYLRLIEGVRTGQVAYVLGPDRVKELGAPPAAELVAGTRELIDDALRMFRIEDETVLARVAESIEAHAARTLFEERWSQMPSSFTNYLQGLSLTPA